MSKKTRQIRWLALIVLLLCAPAFSSTGQEEEVARLAAVISSRNPEINDGFGIRLNPYRLAREVGTLSRQYGLDPLLVLAMIDVESRFQVRARSPRGAIGLLQIRPIVLKEVGEEIEIEEREALWDPYQNIHVGIRYLTFLLTKYRSDFVRALVAYNMGPTLLDQRLASGTGFSTAYYQKVMRTYRLFQRQVSSLQEVI